MSTSRLLTPAEAEAVIENRIEQFGLTEFRSLFFTP